MTQAEFKLHTTESGDVIECSNCDSADVETTPVKSTAFDLIRAQQDWHVCRICYNTLLGLNVESRITKRDLIQAMNYLINKRALS